jgi:squalene-associated FAD-dependent desaturase
VSEEARGTVAIVGGGYAGLAAAVELSARGIPVTVYEAARELGGRARRVERHGMALDNGQHILIGAYRSTLDLMRRVGVPDTHLHRMPLQWRFPPHFELNAVRAPAPLHLALGLLRARGLTLAGRLRCAGFLDWCRRIGFRLKEDRTVARLLQEHRQDAHAIRHLWEPLCVAALNTPVAEASAQIFLNVLRDGIARSRAASELLLPKVDLGALFPRPAAAFVEAHGGEVLTGCAVRRIDPDGSAFTIVREGDTRTHSAVIVATAPQHVHGLLDHWPTLAAPLQCISRLTYQPIITVYLHYPHSVRLPAPMLGMSGRYGQWLFDREATCGQEGLLAVVISARGRNERLSRSELVRHVQSEVAGMVKDAGAPDWTQVITEKRATFASVPDVSRPGQATVVRGLYLAGDYTASDYPATLEAAVRSGHACAELVRRAWSS